MKVVHGQYKFYSCNFVDTSVEGSEGTILPVSVLNSTLILAREVELDVNDSGYR